MSLLVTVVLDTVCVRRNDHLVDARVAEVCTRPAYPTDECNEPTLDHGADNTRHHGLLAAIILGNPSPLSSLESDENHCLE